jgi:hypothetical protein
MKLEKRLSTLEERFGVGNTDPQLEEELAQWLKDNPNFLSTDVAMPNHLIAVWVNVYHDFRQQLGNRAPKKGCILS